MCSYLLTLANFGTILPFVAIFVGLGLGKQKSHDYLHPIILVFGITLGLGVGWLCRIRLTSSFELLNDAKYKQNIEHDYFNAWLFCFINDVK